MRAGSDLPIWSCPALRDFDRDMADDFMPYALGAFFFACAVSAVLCVVLL